MNEKTMDCLTNPVACRLLLEVQERKRATAKCLAASCREIPQTTLYRYLKKMTACGILEVVEIHPIRGTVEKVYAVSAAYFEEIGRLVAANDAQAYLTLFTQYITGLLQEFKEYSSQADINLLEDCSAFTLAPAYLTKQEWEQAATEIGAILTRLTKQEKTAARRLHTIGLILTPPKRVD